jgi:hypothetical protein
MGAINQHKKLAMTGELGQDLPDAKAGDSGKPTDQQSKSPLIGGKGGGDSNTAGAANKDSKRSAW